MANIVASKLQLQWSPEQIAGWLKQLFPGYEDYQVSHETIYRSLYIQARGALKKELLAHCDVPVRCAVRAITPKRPMITEKLSTPYQSARGLPR